MRGSIILVTGGPRRHRATRAGGRRSRGSRAVPILAAIALVAGCDGGRAAERPESAPGDAPPAPAREQVDAALLAAQRYLDSEEVERAEAILVRLVERAPSEARAHELLGRARCIRAARGGPESGAVRREAYERYRTAVALAPSAGLHHAAGVVAIAAGRAGDAAAHFDAAAALDPANAAHPIFAAQALIQLGRLDDADAALLRALAIDADEPVAHASRAVIAMEQGRFDDARTHVREARAIVPSDLRFRVQEARIERRAGNARRAVDLLAPLPEVDRLEEGVSVELAASFTALGEHARAAAVWLARHRNSPSAADAVRAAGSYLDAGDREAAADLLREAQLLAPDTPDVAALAARLEQPA